MLKIITSRTEILAWRRPGYAVNILTKIPGLKFSDGNFSNSKYVPQWHHCILCCYKLQLLHITEIHQLDDPTDARTYRSELVGL